MARQYREMQQVARDLRKEIEEVKNGSDTDLRVHLERCDAVSAELEVTLAMCSLMYDPQ
jgi:hypothetical protein